MNLANEYVNSGLSVMPIRTDGSKAPAIGKWEQFQERKPTRDELYKMFLDQDGRERDVGIGVVCGVASGGLECIDCDDHPFLTMLSLVDDSIRNKLTIIETPGGWHILYRCREICGNRKLAMWEDPQSISEKLGTHRQGTAFSAIGKGVRIETRGQGGYIVGEGSPCSVHPSGLPYCHAFGWHMTDIQTIEPDERKQLWHAAMQFDCSIDKRSAALERARRELKRQKFGDYRRDESEPWTWFDRFGTPISDLLSDSGWSSVDLIHWTRPGKQFGTSAKLSTNEAGEEVLTVYSTSAGELAPSHGEAHASYGRFKLLTKLKFGGDSKAAARFARDLMR